jgi:predicted DNA-binding ArsR family transcriptional regulator
MKYFNTLPKIISSNYNGGVMILTNLLARANIVPEALKSPLLYYTYDIQEGDTPEIVAHKYYGDSYRYWIVLFANQIIDPLWDWPLSGNNFEKYIVDKYTELNINPYSAIHHFEKTLTQTDINTNTTTTNMVIIDEDTYNLIVVGTTSYTLPTGVVSVTTNKRAVSYYTYELELNESKRNIQLLNRNYVNEFESELKRLMV